ncbi:MAG: hypothetical protein SCARUB_02048, partial [Candidatus Scalindua rubra]
MRTSDVSNVIISSIKDKVVDDLSSIKRYDFHGNSVQAIEKRFFDTIGKAGSIGLTALF